MSLPGDFGESFFFKKPVAELIADRIEPDARAGRVRRSSLSVLVAVPLGVLAAWKQGTWIDRVVMGFSVLGFSVPVFVIGYALIYLFAIELNWLPVQGYQPLADGVGGLPRSGWSCRALTLSVIYIALIARITRTSVLEVLGEDYIRTARAKGLPEPRRADAPRAAQCGGADRHRDRPRRRAADRRRRRHRERVQHPGLGRLTVDAVLARDYPTMQAVILLFSFVYVLINLLVDVAYTVARSADPLLSATADATDSATPRAPPYVPRVGAAARLLRNPVVVVGAVVLALIVADRASRRHG